MGGEGTAAEVIPHPGVVEHTPPAAPSFGAAQKMGEKRPHKEGADEHGISHPARPLFMDSPPIPGGWGRNLQPVDLSVGCADSSPVQGSQVGAVRIRKLKAFPLGGRGTASAVDEG